MNTRRWTVVLAALALVAVAACKLPEDPCPTPPEQHPAQWRATPITDKATGDTIAFAWVCVG